MHLATSDNKMSDKKDAVPAWDGTEHMFLQCREDVILYSLSVKPEHHMQIVPRLVQRLSGPPRVAVSQQLHTFIEGGVERLLQFLESTVARQPISELSHALEKFFYKLRRRSGEGMSAW